MWTQGAGGPARKQASGALGALVPGVARLPEATRDVTDPHASTFKAALKPNFSDFEYKHGCLFL